MAFRFPFETLLNHRRHLEEAARKEFMEAQKRVDDCLAKIKSLYGQRDETRQQVEKVSNEGGVRSQELLTLDEYVDGLTILIERERIKARELMQVAEEKRELLVIAAREFKILQKLKEKKWQEFRAKMKKIEEKEMQDLVTMRFRRNER